MHRIHEPFDRMDVNLFEPSGVRAPMSDESTKAIPYRREAQNREGCDGRALSQGTQGQPSTGRDELPAASLLLINLVP